MVRENLVFRTRLQKVSSEDILRALRVSSLLCVFRTLDLICPSGDFAINGRYGRTHNLLQCEYTYVNSLTSVWDTVYKLSEKFLMRFFKEFPSSFCEDVSLFCFLCSLLTKN